jgi:hypothetical protein
MEEKKQPPEDRKKAREMELVERQFNEILRQIKESDEIWQRRYAAH